MVTGGTILREEGAYRRGMVLGLTVAEILILVLFVLLLLLAALLGRRGEEIARAEERAAQTELLLAAESSRRETLELALVELQERVEAAGGSLTDFPDAFRELVALRERTLASDRQLDRLRQELEIASTGRDTLQVELAERAGELDELQVELAERADERDALAAELTERTIERDALAVDLDRRMLERQELRAALARTTIELERARATRDSRDAADELLDVKVAATDQLLQMLGEPSENAQALESLETFLAALRGAIEGSPQLAEPKALLGAISKLDALSRERQDLAARVAHLAEQIGGNGRGIDWPPCWANAQERPEYLFDIRMRDDGLMVAATDLPHRATERSNLPFAGGILSRIVDARQFSRETAALYQQSVDNNCRFYVRVIDETSQNMTASKYKSIRQAIENHFYIFLARHA